MIQILFHNSKWYLNFDNTFILESQNSEKNNIILLHTITILAMQYSKYSSKPTSFPSHKP